MSDNMCWMSDNMYLIIVSYNWISYIRISWILYMCCLGCLTICEVFWMWELYTNYVTSNAYIRYII